MNTEELIKKILYFFKRPIKTIAEISYLQPGNRLIGKKIVVTGGSRGLGAAMAKKFVEEGAEVLITGRHEDTLRNVATVIGCKYLTFDVTDVFAYDDFLRKAIALLGDIHILINNAGISEHEKTFFDVTPEGFDAQINTNLRGGFFLSQKAIAMWLDKKQKGVILFTSSETGETVDYRPYGFTKAAINSMVKGLAYMFAPKGIRINAVAPGVTCSAMTGYASTDNLTYPRNILGRLYLPEEVAEIACFLISDAAGCISGQIITCNNGKSVNARWK